MKPYPKDVAVKKFRELFGHGHDLKVVGRKVSKRVQMRTSKGWTSGETFWAALLVDGVVACSTAHRDWRTAYQLLGPEVEKLYADGLSLV